MSIELRDRLRAKYVTAAPSASTSVDAGTTGSAGPIEVERAFVTHADSGRTIITAPVREVAAANPGFLYLTGRFVEADNPNRNNAFWATEDLELGESTVAGGPLNWLHNEYDIIGSLTGARLVTGAEAERQGVGNHISSDATVWRFLFPGQATVIEQAALEYRLHYSMECISREVQCLDTPGRPGCGQSFPYGDYDSKRACAHLNSRESVRRFVDPIFLGGAIIVPPVAPGWPKADVEVMRQAAKVAEQAHLTAAGALTRPEAEGMVAAILKWANR